MKEFSSIFEFLEFMRAIDYNTYINRLEVLKYEYEKSGDIEKLNAVNTLLDMENI